MITRIVVAALTATAIVGATAAPADAATTGTLKAGLYVSAAVAKLGVLPGYVPVFKPGVYATTRKGRQVCSVRSIGWASETVDAITLAYAKKGTIRVSADVVDVEVTGPCVWKRK